MGLSNDLISQFVKVTKDDVKTNEETTVYGTTVDYDGRTYVKIDGSDLLTPVTTTAVTKPGERVSVMIKNHTATITGNISSPAARKDDLQDVEELANQISEFEIVIADKVDTEELNAQKSRIDELYADNVTIKKTLTVNEADIDTLQASNITILETLDAAEADIEVLKTDKLDATKADMTYATITNLEAVDTKVYNLNATYAEFASATADELEALSASIADLEAGEITVDQLDARYATIAALDVEKGRIDDLEAEVADIDTLIFGSATGSTIQTSFANSVIAQLGDAQIKSAMIEDVSASKITSGDIITNNVRVMSEDGNLVISDETIQISDSANVRVQIGKDSSGDYSINIWDAEGNLMFSKGGITDSAIKEAIIRNDMVSDTANIAAHKLDIDSLFEEINGSDKTIKSTRVYLDDESQTLDVAFKTVTTDIEEIQNGMTSQGTQITAIQGQIASKIWQQDINTAISDVGETTDNLSSQYEEMQQDLSGMTATVANHTATLETKADSTAVTEVSDKVTALETTLDGFQSSVSSTYVSKTEFNELSVGGANLLRNSDFSNGTKYWTAVSAVMSVDSDSTFDNYLSFYTSAAGSSNYRIYADTTTNFTHKAGVEYTLSFWAKASEATTIQTNTAGSGNPVDHSVTTSWQKFVKTYTTAATGSITFWPNVANVTVCLANVKLELGNRATDWSPSPDDMATTNAVDGVQSSVDMVEVRVTSSETLIQQLTDSIANLVTDSNGESLMTQTSTGWTFSTEQIQSAVNATSENLNTLTDEVGDISSTVGILQQAVDDLGILSDYVKITTYENEPCIELGETDSDFKLLITNTRIMFMEGSGVPAYINNQSLFIKKAVVEEELQQGEFIWKARSNGNLGLIWKGATS